MEPEFTVDLKNRTAQLTYKLSEATDPNTVGPKSVRLQRVEKQGLRIPTGFVLATAAYSLFLEENQIRPQAWLASATSESCSNTYAKIRHAIYTASLPTAVLEPLQEAMSAIPTETVAIRSSAIQEDFDQASFAGVYQTTLDVPKHDGSAIARAVLDCYASLYSENARCYRQMISSRQLGKSCDTNEMAVIIQAMVPAKLSGVLFTQGRSNSQPAQNAIIEAVDGLAEQLVSGVVAPNYFAGENSAQPFTELPQQYRPSFAELEEAANRLERLFQEPQDIEWALEQSDQLYILQTRPQTQYTVNQSQLVASSGQSNLCGIVAVAPFEQPAMHDYILVLDKPKPQYLSLLDRAKAVICNQGGLLNHLAIVCREIGIPYIVDPRATVHFRHGESVRLTISSEQQAYVPRLRLVDDNITLIRFIPPFIDKRKRQEWAKNLNNLPDYLQRVYKPKWHVTEGGVYMERSDHQQLVATLLSDLSSIYSALCRAVEEPYHISLGLLSAAIIEPLFAELVELSGSVNDALALLRGVDSLYLSLGHTVEPNSSAPFLQRFAVCQDEQIGVTPALYRQAISSQNAGKLQFAEKPPADRTELLTAIIKQLMTCYEQKNREGESISTR